MPKFRPPNRGRRAVPISITAPTGGLNGRDSLQEMPQDCAFVLENWFPNSTSLDTRGGSTTSTSGIGGAVPTLMSYTGVNPELFAVSNGSVFDATLGGPAADPVFEDLGGSILTYCMFTNTGVQALVAMGLGCVPFSYNGTTWANLAITHTDLDATMAHSPHAFKGRLYFAEFGKLGFYYLDVAAIQGAAEYFDLMQQTFKGGETCLVTSVSHDSGTGPQDYFVIATTEGEYIAYAGYDPSNEATWQLVGRYYGPRPINDRSAFRYRSDTYFVTIEGIISFRQLMATGEASDTEEYITAILGRNYTDLTTYTQNVGWTGLIYPRGHMLMVNVPMSGSVNGTYIQYVMNTNTDRWAKFTGWNAISWALHDERLYFGTSDGRVVKADDGYTDDGTEVRCIARQAWNTYDDGEGMGAADKQYHFATFAVRADGQPSIAMALNVNYMDDKPQYATSLPPQEGSFWDTSPWNTSFWSSAARTQNLAIPIGKIGYTASPWVNAASVSGKLSWYATRITFEKLRGVLIL